MKRVIQLKLGMIAIATAALVWFSGCAGRTELRDGSPAKLRYDTGIGYLNKGNPQEAIKVLKEALEIAPRQPLILHGLGLAYLQIGMLDAAVDNLEQAAELDESDSELMNNLSSAYLAAGRYEKAIAAATRAIDDADYRTPAAARFNRGSSYMALDRMDEATEDFTAAIRLDPLFDMPYMKMGDIAFAKADYAGAITSYDSAIKLNPTNFEAMFNRGKAYWHRGLLTDAESDFNKVLRNTTDKSPLNRSAREWLEKIQ